MSEKQAYLSKKRGKFQSYYEFRSIKTINMKNILTNRWFGFVLVGLIYVLWVIWLDSFLWLVGLAVIFDIYITKKVHWAFWKKKNTPDGKQTKVVEWLMPLSLL